MSNTSSSRRVKGQRLDRLRKQGRTPIVPHSVPSPALLKADLVRGHSKLPGCFLPGLCLSASAHPVPPIRVLKERVIQTGSATLPRPLYQQPLPLQHLAAAFPHLPGGYGWVMDSDKIGRDSVAPPQLPRDAPVSTNSKG